MFCSKCGTMLPDGANFCSSCGSPVAAPNPVYNAPNVEPATSNEQVYQSPVIESVEIPASETIAMESSFSAPVNETPAMESPFSAPVNETPAMESPFSAPVNNTPAMESPFSAPVNNTPAMESPFLTSVNETPVMNYNNQAGFNSVYPQQQNTTYTNTAFETGNTAPNPQPVYPNSMGIYPDNSQSWGPLMPPKKKSKAPVIIVLSIIALLIVAAIIVCCLIFHEKKAGSNSADDALIAALNAFADDDSDDILKAIHPIYSSYNEIIDDFGNAFSAFGISPDSFAKGISDSMNPKSGGFKYNNLKIVFEEDWDRDAIDSYNDTISYLFQTFNVYLSAVGRDLGDAEDYMCESGVHYSGTVDIDNVEYHFSAEVVKINGRWYLDGIESYEN